MPTQWKQSAMDFESGGSRKLVGAFDGGAISSNGGVLLLAAADKRIGLGERLAVCFTDHRHAGLVTHALADLLRQRIFGLALGHEDLIDHDALRFDPALTAALGRPEDALAGKSKLNRLEHAGKIGLDRHHKLDHDPAAIERLLVDLFIEAHAKPPVHIVLDLDATDDTLHGEQEGRHFLMSQTCLRHGATTTATAICRCISSAAGICWRRSCATTIRTLGPRQLG